MARLSPLAGEVRRLDHDRFLCTLFAPPEARESLFALYAFNAEVARVREAVTEPLAGRIRLQWWRDVLEDIYGGGEGPPHQVARALAGAVRRHRLSRQPFERLLEAREFDLDDDAPADMAALLSYAEATSATLAGLSLEILEARDAAALEAGRHVGLAWALTGLLRAIPFHAAVRRVYLPATLSRAAGVDFGELFEGRPGPGLRTAVAEVAEVARRHIEAARRHGPRVPRRALPALLPATLAEAYLGTLAKAGFDPFKRRVRAPGRGRLIRLAVTAWRGRY